MKYKSLGVNCSKRRYSFFCFRVWLVVETDIFWCNIYMWIEVLPEVTLLVPKYYISNYPESSSCISHCYSHFHNIILIQFCRILMLVYIYISHLKSFSILTVSIKHIWNKNESTVFGDTVSSLLTYSSPIGKNQDLDPVPKMFFFSFFLF